MTRNPNKDVLGACVFVAVISTVALIVNGGYMVHTLAGYGERRDLPIQVYLLIVFGSLLLSAVTVLVIHRWRCRR